MAPRECVFKGCCCFSLHITLFHISHQNNENKLSNVKEGGEREGGGKGRGLGTRNRRYLPWAVSLMGEYWSTREMGDQGSIPGGWQKFVSVTKMGLILKNS
uniref:Uncharacterized protein n=1 Tax=Cacopsylla melanoneura TaxID=428564 RepID=A0A8D8U1X0_9HEMI